MEISKPNIKELRKKLDVEGLIKALRYSDSRVRREAASALREIAEKKTVTLALKKTVEPLIAALKDENVEVRKAAAHAFSTFGIYRIIDEKDVKSVEDALKEILKDEDKNVAWGAASALAVIPMSMELGKGERLVRQLEKVDLEALPSIGLLFLTNRRLIFNGVRVAGSFSYELLIKDIVSCEVKKSMFGGKKLAVSSPKAILKQRLQLETGIGAGASTTYSWKEVGERVMEDPKPAVFTGIEQPETLKSEIMEQVESIGTN
jgi:uncharacterized protein (UPF0147 family)